MNIQEAACHYVQQFGWAVFPLRYGSKAPATRHGVKDATRDLAAIRRLFEGTSSNPEPFGLAVATGSCSGIWVLDIDGETGRQSLATLLAEHTEPLATMRCRTGGGGMHLYFRVPPHIAGGIRNRAAVAPGIDVRGEGGYVVAPPSMHKSGKRYAWDACTEYSAADIRPAPDWLADLVVPRAAVIVPDVARRNITGHTRYAARALEEEVKEVAAATPGRRNDTLNKAAFNLGQLIGAGALERVAVEGALNGAAQQAGLGIGEIKPTVASGLDAGMRQPRDLHAVQTAAPGGRQHEEAQPMDQPEAGGAATMQDAHTTEDADAERVLVTAEMSDKGNAECLAHLYGDRLRYDQTSRRWRVWRESHWRFDLNGEAERLITRTVRARRAEAEALPRPDPAVIKYHRRSENQACIRAALESAQSLEQFTTTIDQYDADGYLACSGDVTLDLHTCTARPPVREDYITLRFGAAFDPAAACPRWQQFLNEVFAGDGAIIAYIQRAVGYCLTGSTKEQKCWVCVGKGANGKSVFLNLLHKLLGDYAGSTSWDTFDLMTNEARGDLAKLRGCRIVTVVESNEDVRLNEARIKSLTGSDKVTARALYAHSFDYVPTYKIWFATNNRPKITGTDNGIWRRIQLIPFGVSFDGARRDLDLEAKLVAELPGILNWALAGLAEWHRQGLNPPASITTATDEYRADSDIVGQWIEQCCMKGEGFEMTVGAAYASYKAWCEQNGLHPYSQISMSRKIMERGFEKLRNRKGQFLYMGLGLPQ